MRLDWFKFYPSDFLNSPDVMMMTPAARGCYITLLGRCWLNAKNGGGIPSKTDYILAVCNCTEEEWDKVRDAVLAKFEKKNGQLFNPRIQEEILETQDSSETQRKNAQQRWHSENEGTRSQRLKEARIKGTHTQEEWEILKKICNNSCVLCQSSDYILEKEHIIPLCKNGSDSIDNIQPMCAFCNSKKGGSVSDLRPSDWKKRMPNACQMPAVFPIPQTYIDKIREDKEEKRLEENKPDFQNLRTEYKKAIGKSCSNSSKNEKWYLSLCKEYGEPDVLAACALWAEEENWRDKKPDLYFFFSDISRWVEAARADKKPEDTVISESEVERINREGNEQARTEAEKRAAKIREDEAAAESLRAEPFAC